MRTRTALISATVLAATLLPAPPSQAAEAWVRATPDVKMVTQGYGHGIGLSQHGAKARAEAGQVVGQILGFYYPGTVPGRAEGAIRVLITGDSDKNTIVRPVRGLTVVDLRTGQAFVLPAASTLTAWRLASVGGRTQIAKLVKGTWIPTRTFGGAAEFRSGTGVLTLAYGSANHTYRGTLRFIEGRTVNVVGLEAYLRGVVPAEMPALWSAQAVRAQAVAARTYAAFERNANASRSFQVYDTTASQVYKGYGAEHPASNAAIAATAYRIQTYGGAAAFTQFSASNGGYTAKGSQPYLVSKPDPFDTAHRNSPATLGPKSRAKIAKAYPGLGTLQRVRVVSRGADGRVVQAELDGAGAGTQLIGGSAFRSLIGIKSANFRFVA